MHTHAHTCTYHATLKANGSCCCAIDAIASTGTRAAPATNDGRVGLVRSALAAARTPCSSRSCELLATLARMPPAPPCPSHAPPPDHACTRNELFKQRVHQPLPPPRRERRPALELPPELAPSLRRRASRSLASSSSASSSRAKLRAGDGGACSIATSPRSSMRRARRVLLRVAPGAPSGRGGGGGGSGGGNPSRSPTRGLRAEARARARASHRDIPAATRSRNCSFCACFLMPNLRCESAFHLPRVNHPGLERSADCIPSGKRRHGSEGEFEERDLLFDAAPEAPRRDSPGGGGGDGANLTPHTAISPKPDARAMPMSRRNPRRTCLSVSSERSICSVLVARNVAASPTLQTDIITELSAVCGEYTPAGVLFRLARRPVPRPEGGGFVVVGVGEGARGALGHRGDRHPVRGSET